MIPLPALYKDLTSRELKVVEASLLAQLMMGFMHYVKPFMMNPDLIEAENLLKIAAATGLVEFREDRQGQILSLIVSVHDEVTSDLRSQGVTILYYGLVMYYFFSRLASKGIVSVPEDSHLQRGIDPIVRLLKPSPGNNEINIMAEEGSSVLLNKVQSMGYYKEYDIDLGQRISG